MKVSEFEISRARKDIDRCISDIRDTGWQVDIVDDCKLFVFCRGHNLNIPDNTEESDWMEPREFEHLLIDPLNFFRRLQAEASIT